MSVEINIFTRIDRRFCRNSTVEMSFPNEVNQITLQFKTNKRHRSRYSSEAVPSSLIQLFQGLQLHLEL